MTQTQISTILNNFITNTPTNAPLSAGGDTGGQCTAVPIKFYQLLGWPTPPMANDSANGWGTNFPSELAPYVTHQPYQAGVVYPEGTVMMWSSPHIAVLAANGDGSNTVKVFEQNADADGSYPHLFNRTINEPPYHEATYVLIPIISNPPPPNPVTYESTTQVTMLTNKSPTTWWELGNTTTDINNFKVAASLSINTPFEVGGYAHNVNFPQYTYAMSAADFAACTSGNTVNNNGINVLDLSPVPPAPVNIPVPVTPSLVNSIPKVQAPDMTPYPVLVALNSYTSAANALTRSGTVTVLSPSDATNVYYKFNPDMNGMMSLTKTPGQSMQWWINPADNVVPVPTPTKPVAEPWPTESIAPAPTPAVETPEPVTSTVTTSWKATYKAFNKENKPVPYKSLVTGEVDDLETKRPWLPVKVGQPLYVYGYFTFTDGIVYGRLKSKQDPSETPTYWYAIPMTEIRKNTALALVDYADLGFQKVMDFVRKKV